jgi:hypothetical protein
MLFFGSGKPMQASFEASISAAVKLNHLPMLLHLLYIQSLLSTLNLLGRTTDFFNDGLMNW